MPFVCCVSATLTSRLRMQSSIISNREEFCWAATVVRVWRVAHSSPGLAEGGRFYSWTKSSRYSFAFSYCPFRLDLHPPLKAGCVVAKSAPLPILRTFAQPSVYRIAMNVTQLFHKLGVISNVEIVVPLLPEMLRIANQTPRYSLLQRLQRIGQRIFFRFAEHGWPTQAVFWLEWGSSTAGSIPLWFAEQEVNMLWHDYVPINLKSETATHSL